MPDSFGSSVVCVGSADEVGVDSADGVVVVVVVIVVDE